MTPIWTAGLLAFVHLAALQGVNAQTANATAAYTPSFTACPSGFKLVRDAGPVGNQSLGSQEASFIETRKTQVLPGAFKDYLKNVQATNVTLPDYAIAILNGTGTLPQVGIALSGGGYRASVFGAGVLNSLDGRNDTSVSKGTGGLLQATTYISGLSGGSWLLTSFAQANFPTIQTLLFGPENPEENGWGGWNTAHDYFNPNGNLTLDMALYQQLTDQLRGKFEAGFPVTAIDVWGRLLSYHFLNGTIPSNYFSNVSTHGAGVLFSQIADVPLFATHSMPFPIIIADVKSIGGHQIPNVQVPSSNTVYEFNPFEMGSFDPSLSSFTPIQFLGTTNETVCVTGFDQASFAFAASSDYLNAFNTSAANLTTFIESQIGPIFEIVNQTFTQSSLVEQDSAVYPNPFFGVNASVYEDSAQHFIALVDAGNNGEAVPNQPLLVKARKVEVIIAVDGNADTTDNFSAGGSMINSFRRANNTYPDAYSFPPVPANTSVFISQGLNAHPTFFGCNSSDPVPLVIYIANGKTPAGEPPLSNNSVGGFQLPLLQATLDQTYQIATQGFVNSSTGAPDSEYGACLACAIVDRVRARNGTARSGVCASCFDKYCWNGSNAIITSSNGTSSGGSSAALPDIGNYSPLLMAGLLIGAAFFSLS